MPVLIVVLYVGLVIGMLIAFNYYMKSRYSSIPYKVHKEMSIHDAPTAITAANIIQLLESVDNWRWDPRFPESVFTGEDIGDSLNTYMHASKIVVEGQSYMLESEKEFDKFVKWQQDFIREVRVGNN